MPEQVWLITVAARVRRKVWEQIRRASDMNAQKPSQWMTEIATRCSKIAKLQREITHHPKESHLRKMKVEHYQREAKRLMDYLRGDDES